MAALSYKAWKKQMNPAARELCEQREGNTQSSRGVRCKRSANHSNFPECNECKTRRSAFMQVMCNAGSSQAQREAVRARMKEHNDEWQEDRRVALRLKDHASAAGATHVYEGDDKCGSHWEELPVNPTGRDSKALAQTKFSFSIQCNVIAGGGGVNRFMVMPKHLACARV